MRIIDYCKKQFPEIFKHNGGEEGIIKTICPIEVGIDVLECDKDSATSRNLVDGCYYFADCRGRTCKQCWDENMEDWV